MTVERFDISRLNSDKVVRTPQGGARIPARLTRTGVFVYRNNDGSPRRELRTVEEVSRADSLATLRDAPVIEGHPDLVKPDNYRTLQRGHISGDVEFDGLLFVEGQVVIQDADALARIDSGELQEISCGYTCDIDQASGVFDGQPFDCIQKNICYNHVGLGPKNWGRAGSDVALRFDSSYVDEISMKKIKLDGKEFEVSPDLFEAFDKHLADLDKASKTRVDAADLTSSKMSLDNVQLKTRLDKAEADLVVARDPARFDAAVEARASLIEQAHKILGKTEPFVRADGKPASNREIQVQIVTALKPDFKADGKSDDYVLALFEHAVSSGVRADSINTLPARLDAMREKPGDSKNDKEPDKDEDDKDKPVNAWRKDLANTKGKK